MQFDPWEAGVRVLGMGLVALGASCCSSPRPRPTLDAQAVPPSSAGDAGTATTGTATSSAASPDDDAGPTATPGNDAVTVLDAGSLTNPSPPATPEASGLGDDAGAGGGEPPVCLQYLPGVRSGTLQSPLLTEVSGVAVSRQHVDRLYVHNDAGDAPSIYALTPEGTLQTIYTLLGVTAVDWEDIAVGPGPDAAPWLYVGDLGDNAARATPEQALGLPPVREQIAVYRVPEPAPTLGSAEIALEGWQALRFEYPAGPRDCEALAVDPSTGDLLLLTKDNDGNSELFTARAPQDPVGLRTLEPIAALAFGPALNQVGSAFVTAMDIHPLGTALLVRTSTEAFLWPRSPGEAWATAVARVPLSVPTELEIQGEGIAFVADGSGYVTISEGLGAAIWRHDCASP